MDPGKSTALEKNDDIQEIILKNDCGLQANIISYGATIKNLFVPDRNGRKIDVVLGKDTPGEYVIDDSSSASLIGRVANRIGNASFQLNGIWYFLDRNEGKNCLHSGRANYALKNFKVLSYSESAVKLEMVDNGEGGFPGGAVIQVQYALTERSELSMDFSFISQEDTPAVLTNHVFFNLSGEDTVCDHLWRIYSNEYLQLDNEQIPTGEIRDISELGLDFTDYMKVGRSIEQTGGLDHFFLVKGDGFRKASELTSNVSGIKMEVFTDQPGMQVYSSNDFTGSEKGKNGQYYCKFAAICFETQGFPDAVNHSNFPSVIKKAGEKAHFRTVFSFGIEQER